MTVEPNEDPMHDVISDLERLGRRSRAMLAAQRLSVLAAWIVGATLGLILIDFILRLPAPLRLALLLCGIGTLGCATWRYLRPALIFRPTLTQLALRVERVMPGVAGRLASSVEFAAAGLDQNNPLAARTVRETQTRLSGERVGTALDHRRTRRDVAGMFAALFAATALAAADPASAIIGLQRVFVPYGSTAWPARTGVESLMTARVHPRGQALALRAGVTRGPADQRLIAHYRLRIDGANQPWQSVVLTHQPGGHIHERLLDTSGSPEEIELYFSSEDDQTGSQRIQLAPPPAVRRATLTVQPPAYAAAHVAEVIEELGQGVDSRAVTETASLAGSSATLRLEMNKPLPLPRSIAETLGWTAAQVEAASFEPDPVDPAAWLLRWTLDETRVLALHLVDEHGLTNFDQISYRIEAAPDLPPSATMTTPQSDETVLPTAVVSLAAQAADDVALAEVAMQAHVQSGGRSMDEVLASSAGPVWRHAETRSDAAVAIAANLDLTPFHLAEGDTVLVSAVATDVFAGDDSPGAIGGAESIAAHTVRSPVRRLRVIGEVDFATQLRRQLGAVRQNAIRIESQQHELMEDIADAGIPEGSGMDRAQAQIGERIAAQRESILDIERLLRQNRLDDPQLSQLLQQSNDLLDAAGRAANRAVEAMEQASRSGESSNDSNQGKTGEQSEQRGERSSSSANTEQRPGERTDQSQGEALSEQGESPAEQSADRTPEDREITDAQQEVRDELTDLIKLLDRDEDTWVVRRQLENLQREQAQLEQDTARLGEQTIGRRPEDLTEQQRSELDRITQRQRDLRDEARQMIENMRQRAQAMQDIDPQAAQAMRSAADTAEQRQLDQDMENAAQRAEQNQMTSAAAAQQSAQSTMQRMQEDIENTRRAQAQQLLRQLASLVESIARLIAVQESERVALGLANDTQNYIGLDRGMIRLNQNTQAVAGEARAAGQEARRIGRTLDRAADAQGVAVAALRAQPVNATDAETAEERSLELLKEAKQLAEEIQQQTQEREVQRRREELVASYREFAERQVAVREETLPLSGLEALDRRQMVEARRLSSAQDEIRRGLNDLRDATSEILDSPIFVHVHRSIDGWSAAVSDAMIDGQVNVDVTDRQRQIADSVGRLIKSLEESMTPPGEFAQDQQQQQQGGQSGEGQQALIPPITQLKLLREIQEQVYTLTKELDSRTDLDAAQRRTRLRDVGQQQRDLLDLGRQMLEMLEREQGPSISEPMPAPDTPTGEPGGATSQ